MILTHSTTTNTLFLLGTFSTSALILIVNNWLIIWFSIELNLLFLLPIIINSDEINVLETSINYFLFQSIGSHIFILSIVWTSLGSENSSLILAVSLIINVGGAPCHQWFPPLINSQPWLINLILSTSQNLPLLLLITIILSNWETRLIMSLITLNLLVGILGGLNQSQFKPLLAYSSIANIGWLIVGSLIGSEIILIYFSIYFLNVSIVIWSSDSSNNLSSNTHNPINPSWSSLTLSLIFIISLWGSPPFIGFAPNLIILSYTINTFYTLSVILVLSSITSLFYYGIIYLITTINHSSENTSNFLISNQLSIISLTTLSPILCFSFLQ